MEFIKKEICTGVELLAIPANRFKTNQVTISLALPLSADAVSANALALGLVARRSNDYPNMIELNRKLASLYGATVYDSVSKVGESQVLSLSATCLDDRFSLDGESISFECIKLLTSLLFNPRYDEKGKFFDEDVESEKRILIEKLNSEENEKRVYVLRQTEAKMFSGEPYAVNKYGSVNDVESLDSTAVTLALKNMLKKAKIFVTLVGDANVDKVYNYLKDEFSAVNREYETLPSSVFVPEAKEVKNYLERIDVKQGKLVMGFRVNVKPDALLTKAMRSFCDIFGGGPYSKLFANVREKMSLCYYCSARYTRLKSYIMIQSGCLEENMDKAVNEIMHQLDVIKSGDFNEEFDSSKMALVDAVMSIGDTPEALEAWYINQITDEKVKSPSDVADEINSVTKEQIIECANLLSLDTVYKLVGSEEE